MSSNWLSAHLFYSEIIDVFLVKALKPYTDTVINTGAAAHFFFIRYEERGPHIRLRIQGEPEVLDKIIKENLKEHFELYFKMYPSVRRDPNLHPDSLVSQQRIANNSVQFIDYEPEIERYGGAVGLALAEKHFFSSSKAVLASMRVVEYDQFSYQYAKGIALKLNLSMIYAFGLTAMEAIDFFQEVYVHWLPFSIARERVTHTQIEQQLVVMAENFEQSFQEQKEDIVSYLGALWEALVEGEEFEDDYTDTWISENRRLGLEYRLAQAQQILIPRPAAFLMKMDEQISVENRELWHHYADFVHLTNNRLGIGNEDESHLAYLIMRSLEEML
jgi:thiopeptide-type bacteriocin biosynthesis protein